MLADLGLAELRQYRPEVAEPADFDEFWAGELAAARAYAAERRRSCAADSPVRHAEVFDVTFPGYGGEPVRGLAAGPARCSRRARSWWWSSSATAAVAATRSTG